MCQRNTSSLDRRLFYRRIKSLARRLRRMSLLLRLLMMGSFLLHRRRMIRSIWLRLLLVDRLWTWILILVQLICELCFAFSQCVPTNDALSTFLSLRRPSFNSTWKGFIDGWWCWDDNSWVFSSFLSATDTAGHEVYDPSRSTTAVQKKGYTWSVRYGDGSGAGGDVYTDTVKVGGTSVTGQAVEVATRISDQFRRDVDSDGLLGLAFNSVNTGEWEGKTFHFHIIILP